MGTDAKGWHVLSVIVTFGALNLLRSHRLLSATNAADPRYASRAHEMVSRRSSDSQRSETLSSDPVTKKSASRHRNRASTVRKNRLNASLPSAISSNESSDLDLAARPFRVEGFRELCDALSKNNNTIDRVQLSRDGLCGTDSVGNMLSQIYMTELVSDAAGLSFGIDCSHHLIGDSVQGLLARDGVNQKRSHPRISWTECCSRCGSLYPHTCHDGMNRMSSAIREDLRNIASGWKEANPEAQLDDVVIHVRCGDVLKYAHHVEYGFVPYSTYDTVVEESVSSIGIVSFSQQKCRRKDCPFSDVCEKLLEDLADHLASRFPHASVSLRNGPDETTVSSYARMVLARQVVCNPSTFCVYPAVASTGTGYIVKSDGLYPWVNEVRKRYENVHVLNVLVLDMGRIVGGKMGVREVTAWLRSR